MRLRNWLTILLVLLSVNTPVLAKENNVELSDIKKYYQAKQYKKIITVSKDYLKKYPDDVDVRLYAGLAYYQIKEQEKAIKILQPALSQYPDYLDIRIALINAYIGQKNYRQAQRFIKEGLKRKPHDKQLLLLKKKAVFKAERPAKKVVVSPPLRIPANYYEIGAYTSILDVNPALQNWNYTSLYLNRKTPNLTSGVAMNYAKRNTDAEQLWLNAAPTISKNSWVEFNYAYADQPEIFPNHLLSGEIFYALPQDIIVSGGGIYRKIAATYLNSYSVSIEKTIHQYYFNFRPTHFQPKSGPTSTLYRFNLRQYTSSDNLDNYIGIVYFTGTSPDLFNLLTVNFFRVKEQIILGEAQFGLTPALVVGMGGGFQRQTFLTNRVRNLTYLNLAIKYRMF